MVTTRRRGAVAAKRYREQEDIPIGSEVKEVGLCLQHIFSIDWLFVLSHFFLIFSFSKGMGGSQAQ